jgi:hypothetical protein
MENKNNRLQLKSNEKKLRISKKLLQIFLKGNQFAHQKINEKTKFLALSYSKMKIF